MDLDLTLCVGRLRASVLRPDRRELKEWLIRGLRLTQAGVGEGEQGEGDGMQGEPAAAEASSGRSQRDVATA